MKAKRTETEVAVEQARQWVDELHKETAILREAEKLLPLTVPEVRCLIRWLVWREAPTPEQVVKWSRWRRKHQAQTKRSHYKRSTAQSEQLQL